MPPRPDALQRGSAFAPGDDGHSSANKRQLCLALETVAHREGCRMPEQQATVMSLLKTSGPRRPLFLRGETPGLPAPCQTVLAQVQVLRLPVQRWRVPAQELPRPGHHQLLRGLGQRGRRGGLGGRGGRRGRRVSQASAPLHRL